MADEAVDALARVLASRRLRELLRDDPSLLGSELEIDPDTLAWLSALDPLQLEAHAATLIGKRFSEVRTLLPRTCAGLPIGGYHLFAAHAELFWPAGHLRHLQDAQAFCDYLRRTGFSRRAVGSECRSVALRIAKAGRKG